MSRAGRRFLLHPITRSISRPYAIPSSTLVIDSIGHLTIAGQTIALTSGAAVATKVAFVVSQAWDNALYQSQSGIWWAVHTWDPGTQIMGDKIAGGTSETTDASGVIEATTTAIGSFIGDDVIVSFGELAGGPASEDIIGSVYTTLQAL